MLEKGLQDADLGVRSLMGDKKPVVQGGQGESEERNGSLWEVTEEEKSADGTRKSGENPGTSSRSKRGEGGYRVVMIKKDCVLLAACWPLGPLWCQFQGGTVSGARPWGSIPGRSVVLC